MVGWNPVGTRSMNMYVAKNSAYNICESHLLPYDEGSAAGGVQAIDFAS